MCLGEEEGKDLEIDPCAPKTNEEPLAKLAKLFAGCVKIPGHSAKIPCMGAMTITAMAQDQEKTEELKMFIDAKKM